MARAAVPPGCPLTVRQLEVLTLLCDGLTYKQAAVSLGVSVSTIRSHVHAALGVLGVADAKGAIAAMVRNGWWAWQPADSPQEATPLVIEHPFLGAYLSEFDKWLASGRRSKRARDAMTIALWGHQTSRKDAA